jgi:TatD DNase family protein
VNIALTDTHAHLQLAEFDRDREAVLKRAQEAGVTTILNIGFNLDTSRKAIRLAEQYAHCWATVGLHPHDARDWNPRLRETLRDLAGHPKVCAIGEAGLDYYRDLSPRDAQKAAFLGQIELARELGLPLVIHNRDAMSDMLATLKAHGKGVPCLLHCFSGDVTDAKDALSLGCFFGIGGPVTYPKSRDLREVAAKLPADRFMVETDAPWLTPQFRRGKRNEPAYVRATALEVADVRKVSLEALAAQTTQTAQAFFRFEKTAR